MIIHAILVGVFINFKSIILIIIDKCFFEIPQSNNFIKKEPISTLLVLFDSYYLLNNFMILTSRAKKITAINEIHAPRPPIT